MTTKLDVVNTCLAVMGETPLNSLSEDHEYKAAALTRLAADTNRLQAKGWWFNLETVQLTVNPSDSRIYLPGDIGTLRLPSMPGAARVAQRGKVLYNLDAGTDLFPDGTTYKATLIRLLPFESLPLLMAEYIAAETVLWFQNEYDGDQTKTRNLALVAQDRQREVTAEHLRNIKVNLLDNSVGLSRIRNRVRPARRY